MLVARKDRDVAIDVPSLYISRSPKARCCSGVSGRSAARRTTRLRPDEMSLLIFQNERGRTVRYFPDKLPSGVDADQDTHEFVYLVDRFVPVDFRPFLYRHARLLSVLPAWVSRILVPSHLEEAAVPFRRACPKSG